MPRNRILARMQGPLAAVALVLVYTLLLHDSEKLGTAVAAAFFSSAICAYSASRLYHEVVLVRSDINVLTWVLLAVAAWTLFIYTIMGHF